MISSSYIRVSSINEYRLCTTISRSAKSQHHGNKKRNRLQHISKEYDVWSLFSSISLTDSEFPIGMTDKMQNFVHYFLPVCALKRDSLNIGYPQNYPPSSENFQVRHLAPMSDYPLAWVQPNMAMTVDIWVYLSSSCHSHQSSIDTQPAKTSGHHQGNRQKSNTDNPPRL